MDCETKGPLLSLSRPTAIKEEDELVAREGVSPILVRAIPTRLSLSAPERDPRTSRFLIPLRILIVYSAPPRKTHLSRGAQ